MYKKGDVEVGGLGWSYDSRYDGDEDKYPYANDVISLPHSCGDWIIGGEVEARLMINDLEAAITKLRAQSDK